MTTRAVPVIKGLVSADVDNDDDSEGDNYVGVKLLCLWPLLWWLP
jgi:hypothetical protein